MNFSATCRFLLNFRYKFLNVKQFERTLNCRFFFCHFTWITKSFITYSFFARYSLAKATTVGAKDLKGLSDVTETEKLPKRLQR